jgi:hypothetical protein
MLTVEDGSIVAGADSYLSLADARTDATNRGLTLSADDTIAESQLRQAYYYLTSNYERLMQGFRVSAEQTGMMPRNFMEAYGFHVANDSIPTAFKQAQVNVAAVVAGGADMNAAQTGQDLASFSVDGVYSESYRTDSRTVLTPKIASVEQLLFAYTKAGASSLGGSGGLYREEMGYL